MDRVGRYDEIAEHCCQPLLHMDAPDVTTEFVKTCDLQKLMEKVTTTSPVWQQILSAAAESKSTCGLCCSVQL